MDPIITLVTLGVEDIDTSIRFYRDGLGFPMEPREDESDVAFFPLDGTWLSIYPRELLAEDATVPSDGAGFSGVTLAHNVATKAEVDEILDEAEAAGGRLVKHAQDVFWGGYSGYFADPDDHLWEVAYPPCPTTRCRFGPSVRPGWPDPLPLSGNTADDRTLLRISVAHTVPTCHEGTVSRAPAQAGDFQLGEIVTSSTHD